MKFDDLDDMEFIDSDLQERLSSWRRLPGVVERSPESVGEAGIRSQGTHMLRVTLSIVFREHRPFSIVQD